MANDLQLNEFRLKDPVQNLPDGLNDPVQSAPGFFGSIKNPLDLWLEESLPASTYQWMTGNTKKKQAKEALEFLRKYPDLKGTSAYQNAERILNRFGYLLDEGGDFSFKEFGNLVKKHPGLVGAEMVNAIVADPWLLAIPFIPTHAEYIFLQGKVILFDQMEFLKQHFPRSSPLRHRL